MSEHHTHVLRADISVWEVREAIDTLADTWSDPNCGPLVDREKDQLQQAANKLNTLLIMHGVEREMEA